MERHYGLTPRTGRTTSPGKKGAKSSLLLPPLREAPGRDEVSLAGGQESGGGRLAYGRLQGDTGDGARDAGSAFGGQGHLLRGALRGRRQAGHVLVAEPRLLYFFKF
jgi:hypothetical protein